jgi:hypothetical protein
VGAIGWPRAGPRCAGVFLPWSGGPSAPSRLRYILAPPRGGLGPRGLPVPYILYMGSGLPRAAPRRSYLVDSASSHMLVSKIKPCMSKYKHIIR